MDHRYMISTLFLASIGIIAAQNCKNGGAPVNGACVCPPNFGADDCSFRRCENGHYNLTNNLCDCDHGWEGVECKRAWLCYHGRLNESAGTCLCDTLWLGGLCNRPVCQNNATIDAGFFGVHCDQRRECNNGRWNGKRCLCVEGFDMETSCKKCKAGWNRHTENICHKAAPPPTTTPPLPTDQRPASSGGGGSMPAPSTPPPPGPLGSLWSNLSDADCALVGLSINRTACGLTGCFGWANGGCLCSVGFRGEHCEERFDCVPGGNYSADGRACECREGWAPPLCKACKKGWMREEAACVADPLAQTAGLSGFPWIYVVIALLVLAIFATILCAVCYFKKKNKNKIATNSPPPASGRVPLQSTVHEPPQKRFHQQTAESPHKPEERRNSDDYGAGDAGDGRRNSTPSTAPVTHHGLRSNSLGETGGSVPGPAVEEVEAGGAEGGEFRSASASLPRPKAFRLPPIGGGPPPGGLPPIGGAR